MKKQIITIAHQKGGVGKTTVAINIQAALQDALLIDLDSHMGLTHLNHLRDGNCQKMNVKVIKDNSSFIKTIDNNNHELVIIDQGGFDSKLNRLVLGTADVIIIPCNQSALEMMSLITFDEILSEINEQSGQRKQMHVLPCRHHVNKKQFNDFKNFIAQRKNLVLMQSRMPFRRDYMIAAEYGLSVLEWEKSSEKSRREVNELCNEIKDLIDNR